MDKLAAALRLAGIEAFNDGWEVRGGDDFIAWIDRRLTECHAGIIVFSARTEGKPWMRAEISTLIHRRITEGVRLIPVLIPEGDQLPAVPGLLRPLSRFTIDRAQAIADQLLNPVQPPELGQAEDVAVHRLIVSLAGDLASGPTAVRVDVALDGQTLATHVVPGLSPAIVDGTRQFLEGYRHAAMRSPARAEREAHEESLHRLGKALAELCLPGDAASALRGLLGLGIGHRVVILFESADPVLLGLPFEALRLPGVAGKDPEVLVATELVVEMLRRPSGLPAVTRKVLAGPIKVLAAVGAPDETADGTAGVLDHEHELHVILDSVEEARRLANVEVRVLEVGSAEAVGEAFQQDAYHVLHLTCHGAPPQGGKPATLVLEDEEGASHDTSPEALIGPIRAHGRRIPLVILNACHTGVPSGQVASFATALLADGVEAVVAMQTSVSDRYATELAGEFFKALAASGRPRPAAALALARRTLEERRQEEKRRGAGAVVGSGASGTPDAKHAEEALVARTLPEYATATLYARGGERVLVDFASDKEPLTARSVLDLSGPVPQLGMDDLIGRRRELRETLKGLRSPAQGMAGVVLTGIGGIGKSAVAGRAMRRMVERGYAVAAVVGRWGLAEVAGAVAEGLADAAIRAGKPFDNDPLIAALANPNLADQIRWPLVVKAVAERDLLLVLDDFEQNLTLGGETFRDPDLPVLLGALVANAKHGRLLVTCRYPIPGGGLRLHRVPLGPLSRAEVRKLLLRLPSLRDRPSKELVEVVRTIGGHPRMLEFLDAILAGGSGRLAHVTAKVGEAMSAAGVQAGEPLANLSEAIQQTVMLGARDVFLKELLEIAAANGADQVLLQVAVSNLPVTAAGVAHMLADGPAGPEEVRLAAQALDVLERLSLVVKPGDAAWVHRWTAEGLAVIAGEEESRGRSARAGRYRMWRVEHETHDIVDGLEAMRNLVAAGAWDDAADVAGAVVTALGRMGQTIAVASVAGELLERLPASHAGFAAIAQAEARAHLALGFTERTLARYQALLEVQERLAISEPDHAGYQRELSVLYNSVGDLYRDLGKGEEAWKYHLLDLEIAERLAKAEPDRADYQWDLSVSFDRMGDLHRAIGLGEEARTAYQSSLAIRERLAQAEPDRADYTRGLAVSQSKLGDLYTALGKGDDARKAYQSTLAIMERMAKAEPARADYKRDLAVSYERVGDLYRALGMGEEAGKAYLSALAIHERLAKAEPDRADYKRGLAVSQVKLGDLFRAVGMEEQAGKAYQSSLAIIERLAKAEPDRADYQRDLSVLCERMGDLYHDLGQGEEARKAYRSSLAIRERLAKAEPDRVDYQRDLSVSCARLAALAENAGQRDEAARWYREDLAIAERLARAEPDRADYQVDWATSLATTSAYAGAEARSMLEQAAAILRGLDREGRLAPAEQGRLQAVERALAERS